LSLKIETLKKQCWSYLRKIKTAINYFFYKLFAQNLAKFLLSKNMAEHWDLPNTGICDIKVFCTKIHPQYWPVFNSSFLARVFDVVYKWAPLRLNKLQAFLPSTFNYEFHIEAKKNTMQYLINFIKM
jgi:hypothetical protein